MHEEAVQMLSTRMGVYGLRIVCIWTYVCMYLGFYKAHLGTAQKC